MVIRGPDGAELRPGWGLLRLGRLLRLCGVYVQPRLTPASILDAPPIVVFLSVCGRTGAGTSESIAAASRVRVSLD